MARRCDFDCSHIGIGRGVTVWRAGVTPHFVGDFHRDIIFWCQPTYCTHEDHPERGELPKCAHRPEYGSVNEGAIVEFYAECTLKPKSDRNQGRLF